MRLTMLIIFLFCLGHTLANEAERLTWEMLSVTSESGEKVEVESGRLTLPENRSKESTRQISIPYYRLKSPNPQTKAAIFMLAGGPGSSGIEQFKGLERYQEIAFYQSFADVVVFDQRGAGGSIPALECQGQAGIETDKPIQRDSVIKLLQGLSEDCRAYWLNQGVDLSAYNTDENASDMDDLRSALGYEKVILVGGSYGSHLGLHYLRKFPEQVENAIFYGLEGPDHTYDRPSQQLETLKRIAHSVEASGAFQTQMPNGGLIAALERVIERVKKQPVKVLVKRGDQEHEIWVNELLVQFIADWKASSRDNPHLWPELILAMDKGDFSLPARAGLSLSRVRAPNAMKFIMDTASGVSPARRSLIDKDPANHVFGFSNLDLIALSETWNFADLGESFRENVQSDKPVLLIHGTWDTSTPIDNARDVLASLSNGHLIEVVGGSHGALYNLYENWPPMRELVKAFMLSQPLQFPAQVVLDPVTYPSQASDSDDAQTRLWEAARSGDLKLAREAIEGGADVNLLDTRKSRSGRRALNWAAWFNHPDMIDLLLELGAQIDATNSTGYTAFHHAVENGSVAAAQRLITAGCDRELANNAGTSPSQTATKSGRKELEALLK